jgi:hypothetical protein
VEKREKEKGERERKRERIENPVCEATPHLGK